MCAQVYKGVLNKTKTVAVKTFAHMASEAEVIRFNAVSLYIYEAFSASTYCKGAPGQHSRVTCSVLSEHQHACAHEVHAMVWVPKLSAHIQSQEVQIMQTLSEIPELVTCFPYNPKPRPHRDGKSTPHAPRQLVMELMEARLRSPASADWSAHCVLQSVTNASVKTT